MASRFPAAGPVARLAGPALLVVMTDHASVYRPPAATAQACRADTRLDEPLRRECVTQEMLRGSGVADDIVPMTYRGSRAATRQARRVAERTDHWAEVLDFSMPRTTPTATRSEPGRYRESPRVEFQIGWKTARFRRKAMSG